MPGWTHGRRLLNATGCPFARWVSVNVLWLSITANNHNTVSRWFNARLQLLQYVSNGVTAFLHKASLALILQPSFWRHKCLWHKTIKLSATTYYEHTQKSVVLFCSITFENSGTVWSLSTVSLIVCISSRILLIGHWISNSVVFVKKFNIVHTHFVTSLQLSLSVASMIFLWWNRWTMAWFS